MSLVRMVVFVTAFITFHRASASASEAGYVSLHDVIAAVVDENPELKAMSSEQRRLQSAVVSARSPEDPMIEYMEEDMGMKAQFGAVSQKLNFPVKYYVASKVRSQRAKTASLVLDGLRIEKIARAKELYYSLYSAQKVMELTQANINTVTEFARVAERKYAAGKVPQNDSMRAHVELTRLQVELLKQKEAYKKLETSLLALTGRRLKGGINFSGRALAKPSLMKEAWEGLADVDSNVTRAPEVKIRESQARDSEIEVSAAKWDFAPDFQVTYARRIGGISPENSRISVGASVPLWFWNKSSKLQAARAENSKQEYLLKETRNQILAGLDSLRYEVESGERILRIFETSLLPQAETSYKMAGAAYRSAKGSFLEFLDSERAFYQVRTDYYQALRTYVENLAELESLTGQTLANWTKE